MPFLVLFIIYSTLSLYSYSILFFSNTGIANSLMVFTKISFTHAATSKLPATFPITLSATVASCNAFLFSFKIDTISLTL